MGRGPAESRRDGELQRRGARRGEGGFGKAREGLLRDREDGPQQAQQNWSSFPDKDRNFCISSVKGYAPTYTELAICLEMIRDVKQIGEKPDAVAKPMPDIPRPVRP